MKEYRPEPFSSDREANMEMFRYTGDPLPKDVLVRKKPKNQKSKFFLFCDHAKKIKKIKTQSFVFP